MGGPELRHTSPEAAIASSILSRLGQVTSKSHKGLLSLKSPPRRIGLYFSQIERNSVHASLKEEEWAFLPMSGYISALSVTVKKREEVIGEGEVNIALICVSQYSNMDLEFVQDVIKVIHPPHQETAIPLDYVNFCLYLEFLLLCS